MYEILQSTARIIYFRAFLASDGKTPATGKTIVITISKNAGAFGNPSAGATNATELSSGWYYFTTSTTDTATLGPWAFRGTHADIDDVGRDYVVVLAQPVVNLGSILGTALTETAAGYIAGAFKKLFDIQTPVLTTASVNQTGDSYARIGLNGVGLTALASQVSVDAVMTAVTVLQGQVTALNNLSAKTNLFGALLLEIPEDLTRDYLYELYVRDDEDKFVDLDEDPTISLLTANGADRNSYISDLQHPAVGRYTFHLTIQYDFASEVLNLTVSGEKGGEERVGKLMPQVVDYDTGSIVNQILTLLGTPVNGTVSNDIAQIPSDVWDYSYSSPVTLGSVFEKFKELVTNAATIAGKLTGMTSLPDWIRRFLRKDAGTAGMITAQTEINTGGSSTFDGTTDDLEYIKDNLGSGGGSTLTGPFTRTFVVTDSSDDAPIENAQVRFFKSGEEGIDTTDPDGEVSFTTTAATWSYAITANGYTGVTGTVVVTADGTTPIELDPQNITPSVGEFTTGFGTAYDQNGAVEEGVEIKSELVSVPSTLEGVSFDTRVKTTISDENGLFEITGLAKGCTYRIWRGSRRESQLFTIPSDAGSTYELPPIIGREQ